MQKAVNFTRSLSICMVSKSFLSTISSRFGDDLTLTIYLQIFCGVQDQFFREEGRSFRQETTVHGPQWGRRRWRGMSCSCAVVHRLSESVSIFSFFFLIMLSRKSSISKTIMQQRRRGHACAVLPLWCAGHIIVKSVRQVPTLTWWSTQPRHVCLRPTT